ncbi:MAG: hypothetical protein CBC29_00670 [Methylococcaceae bacterium TMED69]|nr:MAG: hypothetical protein CBC29_00670 [Methylococcaceae bacterium TMED69]
MSIKFSNVIHSYASSSDHWTLKISDWEIGGNESIFIHGPSGCGKTTLLRLIAGLISPLQGSISVFNQRIDLMNQREKDRFRANNVGFVFQEFNLIPYLSAIENVRLAQKFAGQQIKMAELFGLFAELNLKDHDLHKPTNQLSIGEKQRVAIVRAMINRPNLLIVDEPTSSLDKTNKDDFMRLLMDSSESNGTLLLFVSHEYHLSSFFNKAIALYEIAQIQRS